VKRRNATIRQDTFKDCHSKLLTAGLVMDPRRIGRPSISQSKENVALVRVMFTHSQLKSSRQAARESGLSRHTLRTVLKKDLNFRLPKPHYIQELTPEDCDCRIQYVELMLGCYEDWPKLFENILWSDEAVFHIGGFIIQHNCPYWAAHDPEVTVQKMQNGPVVTVWCVMTATRVIGPYLLHNTMNAKCYLHMLENYMWRIVSGWENISELGFMPDGASPHFALSVGARLYREFLGRWLGRRRRHKWPASSPDFMPFYFFLWGWVKEEVYRAKPGTMEQLEDRIWNVTTNVPHDLL